MLLCPLKDYVIDVSEVRPLEVPLFLCCAVVDVSEYPPGDTEPGLCFK